MKRYDIDALDNRDAALIERLMPVADGLKRWHRAEVSGLAHVPAGAALFVGNHNGAFMPVDTFLLCAELFRSLGLDAVPFGLAHETAMQLPLFHQLLVPLGAVRASHANAERLLAAGSKVLVYPGGELDAFRPFRDRGRVVFDGRTGYVRLALRMRVPIVPVVAAGAHSTFVVLDDGRWLARALRLDRTLRVKVWPIVLSVPWGLTLGPAPPHFPLPARVLVEVLEPMRFDDLPADAADDPGCVADVAARVQARMQSALDALEARRR